MIEDDRCLPTGDMVSGDWSHCVAYGRGMDGLIAQAQVLMPMRYE